MPERPRTGGNDGEPDFGWLYPDGRPSPSDPDQTRPVPRRPRHDETRVLPTQQRPASRHQQGGQHGSQGGPPLPPRQPREPRGSGGTPPPARPAKGGGRGPRGRMPVQRVVLLLLAAWVVFLVVVPVLAWQDVRKVNFEPNGERPGDQPGTTYLLVGSDSRAGLTAEQRKELTTGNPAGNRTDTIMLLHTGDGPNLLMSIPRDSQVEIPGHGTGKINAAFAFGGARLLVRTIEHNTGIKVDEYTEIGMGGVVSIVDAVGGIEICPEFDMKDADAGLDIKKGCQEADGVTALGYARSRKTDPRYGDITRAKHQREVVSSVGREAMSPWSVINPVRYYRLANAMPDSFAFGEGAGPVRAGLWALAMTRVNGEAGMTCGVPISDLSVRWDDERSAQMFDYIKNDKTADLPKALCSPTGLPKSVTG